MIPKNSYKIISICLFLFFITEIQGQWTWRNPVPQGNDLNVIRIKNDNSVWAVGYVGTVMHSENGGNNWEIMNLAKYTKYTSFIGLDWTDDSTCFIVDRYGYIYRSQDQGVTWDSLYWETDEYLNASFFTDSQHGFVVCSGGKIISTQDGGNSWNAYYCNSQTTLNCVNFPDLLTGYTAGNFGYILKTTNGGNDWTTIHIDSSLVFRDILFTTINTGFAIGNDGLIMKTADGGTTWSTQYQDTSVSFLSIAMFSPDTLILCGIKYGTGMSPVKYITTDGGTTWTQLQLPPDSPFTLHVAAKTGGKAYTAGSRGTLEKTTDYGTTWTSLSNCEAPPESWGASILGIDFANSQKGFAVIDNGEGGGGKLLKTDDGGATWHREDTLTTYPELRAIDFLNENIGCMGGGSNIYSTFDGGDTWVLRMSGLPWRAINDIAHTGNGVFVAVGYEGFFLRSTDFGQSWYNLTGIPDLSYRTVCFANDSTGFAAGSETLLKTTDAGATWSTAMQGYRITAIDFVSPDKGFAVGAGGLILRTIDCGQSWEPVSSPTTEYLCDVHFYDADTGYAVGGTDDISGVILKTTNGGIIWQKQFFPSYHPLNAVAVNGSSAFAGGLWCCLFGTTNGGIQVSTGSDHQKSFESILIFPNPSTKKITILAHPKSREDIFLSIFSASGMLVWSEIFRNNEKIELDVSSWLSGTYFFNFRSGETYEVKKVVVVR